MPNFSAPAPDRTKRVKDAKAEAQKEIEEYRRQKEEEFKKFEAEV
jgi:V-type H+-transporting ATPase subunit G